jgi:outer membrane protein assembly factor BamD (BamD/ComL family)
LSRAQTRTSRPDAVRAAIFAAPAGLALLLLLAGCASLRGDADRSADALSPASESAIRPTSYEESDPAEDGLSWSDFSIDNLGKTSKKLAGQGPNRDLARQLYREGDDLYRQAMAAEASKKAGVFELAAGKFAAAADRWPDSALAMDALFMTGESYFFADNYPQANLYFEKLVQAFPNNRYMDAVDQRRFAIARYWLDLNRNNPESWYYVNYFNKARPWRDARGSGLRVLDKIRIDDPTGRLSDNATLQAANEYFMAGKFVKADEYYTDLRKSYPTSEHQFLAHFLGLKAKLNSYSGPAYGGTALDEAEKLVKQMRRQFPQEAEREREFLERAAAEIRFRKAERLAFLARYYDNRAEYRAAAHYYGRVIREFEDTPLAQQAEQRVAQIGGLPPVPAQQMEWLVNLFPESDEVKPLLEATQEAEAQQGAQLAQEQNSEIEAEQAANPDAGSGVERSLPLFR